jgi:hypothetical protein
VTTVRVARSFEEAEEFRPAWERLQNDRLTSPALRDSLPALRAA